MGRVFIGVDAGGFRKDGTAVNWIARLKGNYFKLCQFTLTEEETRLPLSWFSDPQIATVAIDAPQGLPSSGRSRRCADYEADTPTRVLPARRSQLKPGTHQPNGKPYPSHSLVRFGCELFWANRKHVFAPKRQPCRLVETYPRAILARWKHSRSKKAIPSKSKSTEAYISLVTDLLDELGYEWDNAIGRNFRVDHCDAMLCALAGKCHYEKKAQYLGITPVVHRAERILREGFIVLPKHSWLHGNT